MLLVYIYIYMLVYEAENERPISRLLRRQCCMLAVKGKYITIENSDLLAQLAGQARNVA